MKVLLIQPAPSVPAIGDALPIGLASIASFLRKNKIDVRLIYLGKQQVPSDFIPDIIGIGASTPYSKSAILSSQNLRKLFPHSKIIFGGHHFTALPEEAFPHADAVVRGEGERAMLDICHNGISDRIITGAPIENLDDIPIPDDDLLDCIYKDRKGRLYVVGARGCPFNCVFCASHSKHVRYHSVDYFVEYLKILSKRYNNNIIIADDIFTIKKDRSQKICEKIIKMQLNLRLSLFGHINCFDKELMLLMKRAGMYTINYGIESGNNRILKLINKNFNIEKAGEVIKKSEEARVNVHCLYMVGNIGETKEMISDTVKFALRYSKSRWCSFAIPFPGSQFYEQAEKYGRILTKDWNKYTNRNIIYLPHGLDEKYMRKAHATIIKQSLKSLAWGILKRFSH